MKTSLLITGGLAFGAMTFAQEKPNIIVILADDLGFSDLGCYGGEVQTPVLDKMAKQGVRMTQMYNSARELSVTCQFINRTLSASDRVRTHGCNPSGMAERICRLSFQF